MNLPAITLPVVLGVGLGSIYFLPSAGETAQSAVRMDLPLHEGNWQLNRIPASEAEITALSKDTEFSKAICLKPRTGEFDSEGRMIPDRIDLSIVLSGTDINNSIHRPERCMPAQGHQILGSEDKTISLSNGRELVVKRLHTLQRIPTNAEGTEHLQLKCLTYYFFIGHATITNEHLERTFVDMKDRLIKGMDQRWAYVSASMWYGELPWLKDMAVGEQEVDEKLAAFVAAFARDQIDWEQIEM